MNIYVPDFFDERKISTYQVRVAVICAIVMFLDGFDVQMISYVAPYVAEDWKLGQETVGVLFSSSMAGLMVGFLLVAPLASRIGHKRMIIITALEIGLVLLLSALTQNASQLIALRFLSGIGLGAIIPSAITITSEYSPARVRATSVMMLYVGASLGFIAAGVVSGWLIPLYGWEAMFWFSGFITLLIIPFIFLFLPESVVQLIKHGAGMEHVISILRRIDSKIPDNAEIRLNLEVMGTGRRENKQITTILSRPYLIGTLLIWMIMAINIAELYALQNWLPTILKEQGHAINTVVVVTATTMVGGIIGTIVAGPLMDRLNRYIVLFVLYVAAFVFYILLGFVFHTAHWILVGAALLLGFTVIGGQNSANAMAALFYPADVRGTGVGWALGIGRFGAICGPLLVGLFMDPAWPPTVIFTYMAIPMLLLALIVFILGKLYHQDTQVTTEAEQSRIAPNTYETDTAEEG